MTITSHDLPAILEAHRKWLCDDPSGARANLIGTNLRSANLSGADLSGADLSGADLSGADLRSANLRSANLSGADLSGADLIGANLRSANLRSANLSGTNLSGADLSGAKAADLVIARTRILPAGAITGFKQCQGGRIVELLIPAAAKRSHAFGRKCRCEYADVVAITDAEGRSVQDAVSCHDDRFGYRVGQRATADSFCDNWQDECAPGIHFYITRDEAIAHF